MESTFVKSLNKFRSELLGQPKVRKAYEALEGEFAVARELIAARSQAGLTQEEVARLMGTTQSVVARLESGRQTPSLRTVQRYAIAVGKRAVLKLEAIR